MIIVKEIEKTAQKAAKLLEKKLGKEWNIEIKEDFSEVGSGSLPEAKLPTWCISISCKNKSAREIAEFFRKKLGDKTHKRLKVKARYSEKINYGSY